ncbi:MAG: sugar phosphate isomerase/epimerase family protein [Pseudomonadota bacterium]
MTPLKIGAALRAEEVAAHRDWLFDDARDIEIQDFMSHTALGAERQDTVARVRAALEGHDGRRGIHGPFEGLDLDNKDPELRPLISARLVAAVECAAAIGATQMVVHSPYTAWYRNNRLASPGYAEDKLARIAATLAPVLAAATREGVTLVVENIQDPDPATRREMVAAIGGPLALSIDTGHAQLARRAAEAPPVDYFVRDAGDGLAHVHLQDVDGHADRHWPPGEGEIEWAAVFRALADAPAPHLVLELRDKATIPQGFAWLRARGLAA